MNAENRVDKMLKEMSIEDMARQMTQVNAVLIKPDTSAAITGGNNELGVGGQALYEVGSTLNFSHAGEMEKIQRHYLDHSENKIPLVFMQDVIHGYRTVYPVPLAMGCTFDTQLMEDCTAMSAVEAKLHGVQVTFAPMVDLGRDARWGRVMETTGEDPYLNGEMGKAAIRGYHRGGIGCCVKHYAAYGGAEAGKDYSHVELGRHALKEFYLRGYEECMKEKPDLVMSSFNMLNGKPVNADHELLVDILRKQWGFDGVLVSDYNAVREMIYHGYAADEKECARIAAENEIDLEMCSATYIKYLPQLVEEGKISRAQVEKMARRVLLLKEKLGILDDPCIGVDYEKGAHVDLCGEHRILARKAAVKSAVLLKNEGVLPVDKQTKVALVGPFAKTKAILGEWHCDGKTEEAVSVLEGIEALLGHGVPCAEGCCGELLEEDTSKLCQAVDAARDADVIIACIGEPSRHSGEGASRADISIPPVQVQLLKQLNSLGKRVVAVLFGGRPQVLTQIEPLVDAILCVWQPGTEGGNAIAQLLYGVENPSGKLTMSFPRSTGQCPIYYNHFSSGRPKSVDDIAHSVYANGYRDVINAPLYPFGYGLSYTTFRVSDLQLSDTVLTAGGKLTASVLVENTGSRDGEEVIQLYIRDHFASMVRPVKELKGYRKISLKAGQSLRVSFEITEDTFKFCDANENFTAEEGMFTVMVGNSSDHVLSAQVEYKK